MRERAETEVRCPDVEQLEQHLAADLEADASHRVSAHLETCPECATRLEEISENLAALSSMQGALREVAAAHEISTPTRIGPFTVDREIARGGMGVVYLAHQDRPQREVALKVLRPSSASPDTLRRFRAEAEVLARLRHPGIATVYEAGVTTVSASGVVERVPYIAMEYVRGERLDRYASSRDLSLEQRLELVAKIADAVHHAHLNGLVHRDLKPGNILVESGDSGDVPKILDFGVARVTDRDAAASLHTSTGQILGTVPYMSPEQLGDDPQSIDARSDVYALGVIAFELLTGALPYDVSRVSLAEAARIIRDESPLPPARRDPRLTGDVETILLAALEKDPARRFVSIAEMAADIRRFLRREPIQARPQSAAYQLRRFAQRNLGLVATVGVLAFAVLAGAGLSAALAVRATRAEQRVREQLIEVRRQADKFEAVNLFLEKMLGSASPEENPGEVGVTVREVLGRASAELDAGSLADQPAIELGVRVTIGNTYRALGEYARSRPHLERAVELGRGQYPDGHADLAFALNKLGRVAQESGDYDTAEAAYRECLRMRRLLLGPRHEEVAMVLNNLAHLAYVRGDFEEARAGHEEALAIRRERFGSRHEDIANSLNNLAVVHYSTGDLETAAALMRESLEIDREMRGGQHPNVLSTMNNLAVVMAALGDLEESERLQRRVIGLQRETYGIEHPELATSLQNLARFLVRHGGDLEEAESLFLEALRIDRKLRGERHPHVATVLGNFAALFAKRGDYARAEELHRDALSIRREAFDESHADVLVSRYNLASVILERGEPLRAERAFAALVDDARRALANDPRRLFPVLHGYGMSLLALGREAEARAALERAVARDLRSHRIDAAHAAALRGLLAEAGLVGVDLAPVLASDLARADALFVDHVHPTAAGHARIAEALLPEVLRQLAGRDARARRRQGVGA